MITEKWHDLRKDPNDLPETSDTVWVIVKDNPTDVTMDSYDPGMRGKDITTYYARDYSVTFPQSGWWGYPEEGIVTHWMYMEVPEPPEATNE